MDLYQEALETAERIKEVRLKIVELSKRLSEIDYALAVARARVERELIRKVGNEKELAPTAADRERIFILARDADSDVVALQKQRDEVLFSIEREKAELSYLREVMDIMKIAMQTAQEEGKANPEGS